MGYIALKLMEFKVGTFVIVVEIVCCQALRHGV